MKMKQEGTPERIGDLRSAPGVLPRVSQLEGVHRPTLRFLALAAHDGEGVLPSQQPGQQPHALPTPNMHHALVQQRVQPTHDVLPSWQPGGHCLEREAQHTPPSRAKRR